MPDTYHYAEEANRVLQELRAVTEELQSRLEAESAARQAAERNCIYALNGLCRTKCAARGLCVLSYQGILVGDVPPAWGKDLGKR